MATWQSNILFIGKGIISFLTSITIFDFFRIQLPTTPIVVIFVLAMGVTLLLHAIVAKLTTWVFKPS